MAFPRRLLLDAEQVVLELHPHWRRLVLPAFTLPVVAGVASYAAAAGPRASAFRLGVLGLALVLVILLSVRPFLRWRSTRYVVTTRRVIWRAGSLRTGRDAALYRITDIAVERGVVDRLFGSGDLVLTSPGEHSRLVLVDVPGTDDVHRTVFELAEQDDARHARAGGGPLPDGDAEKGDDNVGDEQWSDQH